MHTNKIKLKLALFLGILNLSSSNLWAKKDERNQAASANARDTNVVDQAAGASARDTNIVEDYKKNLKLRIHNTKQSILITKKDSVKIEGKISKQKEKIEEWKMTPPCDSISFSLATFNRYLNVFYLEQRVEILEKELEHHLAHINSFNEIISRCEELLSRTPSSDEEEKAFKEDSEQLQRDQTAQFSVNRDNKRTVAQEQKHLWNFEKQARSVYDAWSTSGGFPGFEERDVPFSVIADWASRFTKWIPTSGVFPPFKRVRLSDEMVPHLIDAKKVQTEYEENQKRMNKQAAESWGAFWLACMRNEEQKKQQQSNANLQVEEEQYVPQTQHHRSNQR